LYGTPGGYRRQKNYNAGSPECVCRSNGRVVLVAAYTKKNMYDTIPTLAVEYPGITLLAIVVALYPLAGVYDWVFGQPNNGGFGEKKQTKVRRFYLYTGTAVMVGSAAIIAHSAGVTAGFP